MSVTDPASEVMTVAEVAVHLKVHAKTVYRLWKSMGLSGFRVGGEYRFRRPDIDEWIRESEKASLKKPGVPTIARWGRA
jgi:excisionase family DNA binding protein